MRTTLDIDDDVLLAAKERAARERTSVGAVVSRLARDALSGKTGPAPAAHRAGARRLPALR